MSSDSSGAAPPSADSLGPSSITSARDGRLPVYATQVFVGAYFVVQISIGSVTRTINTTKIEILLFSAFVIACAFSRAPISRQAWTRLWVATTVGMVVVTTYAISPSALLAPYASDTQRLRISLIYLAAWIVPAALAALFYTETVFVDAFWLWARSATWLAIGGFLVSGLTSVQILVNVPLTGGIRLQGLLGEPSAWAPVVIAGVLEAIRRRSWVNLVLFAVTALLTGSPTVLIVGVVCIPLFFAFTGRFRLRRCVFLVAIAIVVPLVGHFLTTADPEPYLSSGSGARFVIGRLISGVQNVQTNGALGTNDRFRSTSEVFRVINESGTRLAGSGPGSSGIYFPAVSPAGAYGLRPNAQWVDFYFNFGLLGLVVFWSIIITTLVRMRRYPVGAGIMLPFIIASMFNSAEGYLLFQFTALAVFLYGFGWAVGRRTSPPDFPARPRGRVAAIDMTTK